MDTGQRSKLQKMLSIPRKVGRTKTFRQKLNEPQNEESNRDLAAHLSCTGHDAAGWLLAIPKSSETSMAPDIFIRLFDLDCLSEILT